MRVRKMQKSEWWAGFERSARSKWLITFVYSRLYQTFSTMLSITYTIEIKWKIKGYESYGFGADKHLYNLHTGRRLKQCLNGGSIGYWISKQFITLKSLRKLLYKPKFERLPF